jgi:hypothetical protein
MSALVASFHVTTYAQGMLWRQTVDLLASHVDIMSIFQPPRPFTDMGCQKRYQKSMKL